MRILSLNGGGMRGFITASILAKLEEETGKPVTELFDLISGVSTGSIVACALGKGISASMLVSLYRELGVKIFKKKSILPWKPWYESSKLEELVRETMEYRFNTAKTKVMVHATKISSPGDIQPKFWKSWQEPDSVHSTDIIVASSSAPIYFAPKKIGEEVYIDGSMVANNPSVCAIVEALSLGVDISDIYMLNINCGEQKGLDKATKLDSIVRWVLHISDLLTLAINAGERSVAYQSKKLLKTNYLEIGTKLDIALDSLEYDLMSEESDRIWTNNKQAILDTLRLRKEK